MMEEINFLVNVQLLIPLHLDMDKCVAIASNTPEKSKNWRIIFVETSRSYQIRSNLIPLKPLGLACKKSPPKNYPSHLYSGRSFTNSPSVDPWNRDFEFDDLSAMILSYDQAYRTRLYLLEIIDAWASFWMCVGVINQMRRWAVYQKQWS